MGPSAPPIQIGQNLYPDPRDNTDINITELIWKTVWQRQISLGEDENEPQNVSIIAGELNEGINLILCLLSDSVATKKSYMDRADSYLGRDFVRWRRSKTRKQFGWSEWHPHQDYHVLLGRVNNLETINMIVTRLVEESQDNFDAVHDTMYQEGREEEIVELLAQIIVIIIITGYPQIMWIIHISEGMEWEPIVESSSEYSRSEQGREDLRTI